MDSGDDEKSIPEYIESDENGGQDISESFADDTTGGSKEDEKDANDNSKSERLSGLLAESVQSVISVQDTINKILSRARKNAEEHSILQGDAFNLTEKLVIFGEETAPDASAEQMVQGHMIYLSFFFFLFKYS